VENVSGNEKLFLYGQKCKYKMGHVFALLGRCATQAGSRRSFGTTYLSSRQEPVVQQMGYVAVEMLQLNRSRTQCRLAENTVMDNLFLYTCGIH